VKKIDISVCLCTYNRLEMLRNTLDSLLKQQTDGLLSYEIIIVDDGSSDGTKEFLKFISTNIGVNIKCFFEKRAGVAGARNRGVIESRGQWIAFIDDDEIVESNYLQEIFDVATKNGADCVGGSLKLLFPSGYETALSGTSRKYFAETTKLGWFQQRYNYLGPGTGFALVRRALFDQIGFFDTSLKVKGEDQDFFRRARKAGYKTVFAPQAIVHHVIPEDRLQPTYLLSQARSWGTSIAYFDLKEWGRYKTIYICVLRIVHAILITAPSLFLASLQRNSRKILSCRCSLITAFAYIRQTIFS